MKRYLLFAYEGYYPLGGWNDFVADFDTEIEAKEKATEQSEYVNVVDTATGESKEYIIRRRAESITLEPTE